MALLAVLVALAGAQPAPEPPVTGPDSLTPASETLSIQQIDREIGQNQQNLDQTGRRLGEVQSQLAQLGTREKASLGRIAAYDERIGLIQRYLRQLDAQAMARSREIARVATEIERTAVQMDQRRQDLDRRLIGLYKHGRTFELEALLSTRSLPEIYRKVVYMRWIARADRKLVASLDSLKQQQTAQQARLVAARAELQRLQEEQGKQQTDLTLAKAAESSLLKKIRTERVASESLAQQLDSATRRLRALLVDLQLKRELKTPAGPSTFEKRKGRLPWPLRGAVIASFGSRTHPLYKTKTSNLGIDIKARPGSQAQAVADGRVSYADQFMGYGNLVILDHGGGYYTLYSNLDEMLVSVGSDVAEGSTVGTAREYLHFEVRKDGRPVDPAAWLAP